MPSQQVYVSDRVLFCFVPGECECRQGRELEELRGSDYRAGRISHARRMGDLQIGGGRYLVAQERRALEAWLGSRHGWSLIFRPETGAEWLFSFLL